MEPVITLQDVSKEFKVLKRREGLKGSIKDLFSQDYKMVHAVNHISMEIGQGEIVGYLGPNGAGKSTTIKMMTGVLEPTGGGIRVNGIVPYQKRSQNAQNIGVVFGQRSQLWWALPVVESFRILKDIYCVSDEDYNSMLELYGTMIDLEELLHKPVRQMSLGQRTLCDILAAFLHNPGVVFLDEPTIGLDVAMKAKIRELIKLLNKEKKTTVILTTHDMGDVDALCQRIVIIDKGSMLYDNDIQHLTEMFGAYRTLRLRLTGKEEQTDEVSLKVLAQTIQAELQEKWKDSNAFQVSPNEEQIEILIDEEKIPMMHVLDEVQLKHKIYDMHLDEISTESVIRKIYEGGVA